MTTTMTRKTRTETEKKIYINKINTIPTFYLVRFGQLTAFDTVRKKSPASQGMLMIVLGI